MSSKNGAGTVKTWVLTPGDVVRVKLNSGDEWSTGVLTRHTAQRYSVVDSAGNTLITWGNATKIFRGHVSDSDRAPFAKSTDAPVIIAESTGTGDTIETAAAGIDFAGLAVAAAEAMADKPTNEPEITLPLINGYYWARHDGHHTVETGASIRTTDTYQLIKLETGCGVAATIRHVSGFRWIPAGNVFISTMLCRSWDGVSLADAFSRVATYMSEVADYRDRVRAGYRHSTSETMHVGDMARQGVTVDPVSSFVGYSITSGDSVGMIETAGDGWVSIRFEVNGVETVKRYPSDRIADRIRSGAIIVGERASTWDDPYATVGYGDMFTRQSDGSTGEVTEIHGDGRLSVAFRTGEACTATYAELCSQGYEHVPAAEFESMVWSGTGTVITAPAMDTTDRKDTITGPVRMGLNRRKRKASKRANRRRNGGSF
jgi:hypothetical protein